MANLDDLRAQFQKASEANRKAYDALHGQFGTQNVFREYRIAKRDKNKEAIDRLKPQFEALNAAYNKTQEEKNRLAAELKKAETAEKTAKTTEAKAKGTVNTYKKAIEELAVASDILDAGGYQAQEKYVAAYQKAQELKKTLDAAGKKSVDLPEPKTYIPPAKTSNVINEPGATGGQQITSYTDAVKFLTTKGNEEALIEAQKGLNKFGYKGNIKGEPDSTFVTALQKAALDYSKLPEAWRPASLLDYIKNPTGGVPGSGTGGEKAYANIYSKTEAESAVNNAFQSTYQRDATPKELVKYVKELQNAQKDPKNYSRTHNGITIGGLGATQFIIDSIKATPDYQKSAEAKTATGLEALKATAFANGLTLDNFAAQLPAWKEAIKAGKSVADFQAIIRSQARNHLPESIKNSIDPSLDLNSFYASYINSYAKTFGIDPTQVKIADIEPLALTDKGTLAPIYEFDKKKRMLPNWQYTPEAKTAVADSVTQVLKDFGFMG